VFNNLIESRPQKQKTLGGTIFSIFFHGLVITGSVIATKQVGEAVAEEVMQRWISSRSRRTSAAAG
jgi:hypothetical protein